MMKVVLFLVLVGVIYASTAEIKCPPHSIPGCRTDNCDRQCKDFLNPHPPTCPADSCSSWNGGCDCDTTNGYWYHPGKGQCVPSSECSDA